MSYASSPIAASAFSDESEVNSQVILTGVAAAFSSDTPVIVADANITLNSLSVNAEVGQAGAFAEFIAEVTGQELITDLGTESVTGGATQVLTGEELSTFTGSVALQTDQVITPTSLLVQFTEGTIDRAVEQSFQPGNTFAGAPFASDEIISSEALVTGLDITSTAGTLGVATDQIIDVTGIQIDSVLGTAEAKGIAVAVVTGEEIDTQAGTLTTQTDNFIDVIGLQIDTNLNSVGIAAGGNITVIAPADQIEAELGNSIITASAVVLPTGVEATFSQGTATIAGDANISLTGVEAETFTGTANAPAAAILTGVEASTELGTSTIAASAVVEPTGEEVSTNTGDITINGDASVTLTGLSLVFADGTPTVTADAVVTPTGLQISFSDGIVDVVGDANVLVTGQLISFALGKETISGAWQPVDPDATNSFSGVSPGATNTWTEVAA